MQMARAQHFPAADAGAAGHEIEPEAAHVALSGHLGMHEDPKRPHVYGFFLLLSTCTRATVHATTAAQLLCPGGAYCGGVVEP